MNHDLIYYFYILLFLYKQILYINSITIYIIYTICAYIFYTKYKLYKDVL